MLRVTAMVGLLSGAILLSAAAASPEAGARSTIHERQPRLVVFESFLKHGCPACTISGRTVDQLSNEFSRAGKNVLFIEQDVNQPVGNRLDRWWESWDGIQLYVPMVMLDSGFWNSYGAEDYYESYSAAVNRALARPAGAEIYAGFTRTGNNVTVVARITNHSGGRLDTSNYATVNALVYERAPILHTNRYVRAATSQAIEEPLAHGATATYTLAMDNVPVEQWRLSRVVVMLDYKPDANETAYDMLQAVEAVAGVPPTRTPVSTPTRPPTDTPTASVTPSPGPSPTYPPGVPIYLPYAETRN